MIEFKSVISFDIETTGLPSLEHNKTRITELAFLGCELSHVKNKSELPRVLHKLVLCFNPGKLIQRGASKCSGLNNELLQNLKMFSQADFDMIKGFIERLPPPVCIVAHYGNKFDFPILRRALAKLERDLPDDVYCADSWQGFQEIFPLLKNPSKNIKKSPQTRQEENETTPPKISKAEENPLNYKKNNYFELQFVRRIISPDVCRELFPEESQPEVLSQTQTICEPSSPCTTLRKVYGLKNIYHSLFNENFPNAHRAEDDAQALLKCILKCEHFLYWMNNNAMSLNSIKPLF